MRKRPPILTLLCVAILALLAAGFIRSLFEADCIYARFGPHANPYHWCLVSYRGRICLYRIMELPPWSYPSGFTWESRDNADYLPGPPYYGCGYYSAFAIAGHTAALYAIVLPIPLLALPFAIAPILWIRRRVRLRPQPDHLCAKCSYDLRAHHPGDKCPECGTPIPPKTLQ